MQKMYFSFLVELRALGRDLGDGGKERFHLAKFWRAEDNIIGSLEELMVRAELEEEIQLDLDEE